MNGSLNSANGDKSNATCRTKLFGNESGLRAEIEKNNREKQVHRAKLFGNESGLRAEIEKIIEKSKSIEQNCSAEEGEIRVERNREDCQKKYAKSESTKARSNENDFKIKSPLPNGIEKIVKKCMQKANRQKRGIMKTISK